MKQETYDEYMIAWLGTDETEDGKGFIRVGPWPDYYNWVGGGCKSTCGWDYAQFHDWSKAKQLRALHNLYVYLTYREGLNAKDVLPEFNKIRIWRNQDWIYPWGDF